MRHVETTTRVPGSPERAFDLAVDPHRMSEQMPWVGGITEVRGRGDRLGDSFVFRDHVFGRSERAMTVVTACHRPTFQTTETTYDNGFRVIWTMHFSPCEEGTEIRNVVWWAKPDDWVGRVEELMVRPILERRLRESGRRYRAMLARAESAEQVRA